MCFFKAKPHIYYIVRMTTATIEIKNSIALDLLQSKPAIAGQKLSEKFAGSLSKENVSKMQKELSNMRNEWERDTF